MAREYRLLGNLKIEENGQPAALLRSPMGCALAAFLIVMGEPQSREVVADLLWADIPTNQALHNLRSLLNRIRKLAPELIITRHQLAFQPSPETTVDLNILRESLATDDAGNDVGKLNRALQLYRGDLLTGLYLDDAPRYEEWLLLAQERLRLKVLTAHERLCQAFSNRGELDQALEVARRWLDLDPLDEVALRQLMTLLVLNEQPNAALKEYATSCENLMHTWGLQPEPATEELADKIRAGKIVSLNRGGKGPEGANKNHALQLGRNAPGWFLLWPDCRINPIASLAGR